MLSPRKAGLAVSKDGKRIYVLMGGGNGNHGPMRVVVFDADGGGSAEKFQRPDLTPPGQKPDWKRPDLILSSDESYAFISGLGKTAAVYRLKIPELAKAEPFFGDPAKNGQGKVLLGGPPRGLALDGRRARIRRRA